MPELNDFDRIIIGIDPGTNVACCSGNGTKR